MGSSTDWKNNLIIKYQLLLEEKCLFFVYFYLANKTHLHNGWYSLEGKTNDSTVTRAEKDYQKREEKMFPYQHLDNLLLLPVNLPLFNCQNYQHSASLKLIK